MPSAQATTPFDPVDSAFAHPIREPPVLRYDFENSVGYWMCMTSHAIRRALSTGLAEEGITLRQWEVLAWLSCDADVSQVELSECMGIEPPTLAGVLRRMERDGWLRRRSCTDDRRRNRLEPTQKADEVWQRSLRICQQVREQSISGFTAAELSLLKKLCGEIRENLRAPGETCVPCELADRSKATTESSDRSPPAPRLAGLRATPPQ
ncbi:MAG: MarR family winged helix-turn-helix transcriptional regulator [Planctomycetaceae bacterium]